MAFQPILDPATGAVFAREALVRGVNGEGAHTILSQVDDANRHAFDQACRVRAIEMAVARHGVGDGAGLSINLMANAVHEPRACIRTTLDTARRTGLPVDRIISECSEGERLDTDHALGILATSREIGFKTAIDDFGAGYAGLALLTRFKPDIVKIDMELVRNVDRDRVKRTILQHTVAMVSDLGIAPLCEGVETLAELAVVQDLGVRSSRATPSARPVFGSGFCAANDVPERSAVG